MPFTLTGTPLRSVPASEGYVRLQERNLMSCMLRIAGTDLDLNDLLKINLKPDSTWEKDTPRFLGKPEGKKHTSSGARYIVSEADFDDFEQQKIDAIDFLRRNRDQIKEMMDLHGIEGADLDFGIYRRDVPVQCDNFPAELITLAGSFGLGLELSQYPSDDVNENESEPPRSQGRRGPCRP